MSQNNVAIAKRPSEARLGRTKDCDGWDAKQCGEMHCTGVVRQQQTALAQLIDQLLKRVPELYVAAVHDFAYETDRDTEIDESTEDVVLILKKK